jgi:hypothetical protein
MVDISSKFISAFHSHVDFQVGCHTVLVDWGRNLFLVKHHFWLINICNFWFLLTEMSVNNLAYISCLSVVFFCYSSSIHSVKLQCVKSEICIGVNMWSEQGHCKLVHIESLFKCSNDFKMNCQLKYGQSESNFNMMHYAKKCHLYACYSYTTDNTKILYFNLHPADLQVHFFI